jgi:hypothetical protein
MGYFKRLSDSNFKLDDHGNTLFYPWGTLGPGYILPDKETERKIRRFAKYYGFTGVTLVFIIGIFLSLWGIAFLLLLPIAIFVWWAQSRRYIRGLQKTGEKLTLSENCKRMFGNDKS